jgi:hypothetical protein
MAAKRRKSEVLPAVQSRAEAIEKLQRYAALSAQIEARAARVTAAIAQLKAEADKLDAPLIEEQQAIFLAIKPWWAVAGATVAEGDRKTAELGGCLLGNRTGNPTLKHPSPMEKAVGLLVERGWKGLLRIKFAARAYEPADEGRQPVAGPRAAWPLRLFGRHGRTKGRQDERRRKGPAGAGADHPRCAASAHPR